MKQSNRPNPAAPAVARAFLKQHGSASSLPNATMLVQEFVSKRWGAWVMRNAHQDYVGEWFRFLCDGVLEALTASGWSFDFETDTLTSNK